MERLENCDVYQHILHTKKPDFSKLNEMCKEFEESILEAQEADRKNYSRFWRDFQARRCGLASEAR